MLKYALSSVLAFVLCIPVYGQTANADNLGLSSQDHAELARLGVTDVFREQGGRAFEGIRLMNFYYREYMGLDRWGADLVIQGYTVERARVLQQERAADLRRQQQDAKYMVLQSCEDAKDVPSNLIERRGLSRPNAATVQSLLVKMFDAAGVECHVPAVLVEARPNPAVPASSGSTDSGLGLGFHFGVDVTQEMAWVKEDLSAYIAAAKKGFEGFKTGKSFLNEEGQKAWSSKSKPSTAKDCRVVMTDPKLPNYFVCTLFTSSDEDKLRRDFEMFKVYVAVSLPDGWEVVDQKLDAVDSASWRSPSTGLSGDIVLLFDPSKNEYKLNYQMLGLKSPQPAASKTAAKPTPKTQAATKK